MQEPVIPSGAEIYAMIMAQIEPELLPQNIAGLDAKYHDETPADRKARGKRYKEAFAEYAKHLEAYKTEMAETVAQYRKAAFDNVERDAQRNEKARLFDLETVFSTLPS